MLVDFFYVLKEARIPVTAKELLTLKEAMEEQLAFADMEGFYQLARLCLVKDEKYFDRYDQAFGHYFHNLQMREDLQQATIPANWLHADFLKHLSEEDKAKIEAMGGLDKLLETLRKRLEEQQKKHQGGNKWIGTGGTSPFGHGGYNPEGIRIGGQSRHNKAVKVWEKRQFRNLDDEVELGTRQIKIALRKLRKFARTGAADELDLDDTIQSTAHNGGMLDIKMVPERHNAVKVLIFFDVGGSMDSHVRTCEELFSATRTEFKHLEYYYFHNCIYEGVWKDNNRRFQERIPTYDLINTYSSDYRVIIVGDAAMSPYEIIDAYGSVEHMNEEPGQVWLQRILEHWPKTIWLNPNPESHWDYIYSTGMIREIMEAKMYALTLAGLEEGIKYLSK